MTEIRFEDQVIVITGAGRGLGAAYARFFASRGAKVVVNDVGTSLNGRGSDSSVARQLVQQIRNAGGIAVADYNSVENGDRIIETAINSFGRIHVLINNAGIAIPDASIPDIKDEDWDLATNTFLTGNYRTSYAAWKYFEEQKYGRIIFTGSTAGYSGESGRAAAAAMAMAAFSMSGTLEKEGRELGIKVNAIAPTAVTRTTASTQFYSDALRPDWVVPLVANLAHSSNERSGHIFEVGAGHYGRFRWEQSGGILLSADDNLLPDKVLENWTQLRDFSNSKHPDGAEWIGEKLDKIKALPLSDPAPKKVSFKNKIALVTGGGNGIGKSYCLLLARLGAVVAVNDLNPVDTAAVVKEIKDQGGEAIDINISVEQGDLVVQKVIDTFGRIDIVINNAGIVRDAPIKEMTDKSWFDVVNCHLYGTYKISKAAWPYMVKQKYGRFVNTISTVGLYGNWHQANYSSAKGAIIGFTNVLSQEGAEHNITANSLGPYAYSQMLAKYMSAEMGAPIAPKWIAALTVLLASDEVPSDRSGKIYEGGGGWFSSVRLQRSRGIELRENGVPSAEDVQKNLDKICSFDENDYPISPEDFKKYTSRA